MWTLFIGSMAMALFVSSICSLCEAALLSLTPGQIEEMKEKSPRRSRIWRKFKENIEEPISVILILNTSAHTIGATISGSQFAEICGKNNLYITLFSILFTYLMLQYTEILPKTLGVRYNRVVASYFTEILETLIVVLRPVIWFIHLVNRPFESKGESSVSTLDELGALVRLAGISNLIDKNQVRILEEASKLRKRTAREVMIPVEQITFLSTEQSVSEAVIAAHLDPHTRFPLMEKSDVNQIIGYVNFKELVAVLRTNPHNPTVVGIARTVHFVQDSEKLSDVLKRFVNHHAHIAIVQNEERHTVGLITMEDIVEELVGELEDEFDHHLPTYIQPLGRECYLFGGGVKLKTIFDHLGLEFSSSADENETISSWLLQQFGALPSPGKRFTFAGWDFIIRRVRREKIFDVNVGRPGETFQV